LAAGIYRALARTDLLMITAHLPEEGPAPLTLTQSVHGAFQEETALQRVEAPENYWWVNRPLAKMGLPLSDLVEIAVYDVLQGADEWNEIELFHHIYHRFQDVLTPDRDLVAMCLQSYTQPVRPGVCALLAQDRPGMRQPEVKALGNKLATLGRRLGWDVDVYENGRIVWTERRVPVYTFSLLATAQVAPHLLARRPPRGTPVLVIPEERASLVSYKLQRNVQLYEAAQGAGWQFVSYVTPMTLRTFNPIEAGQDVVNQRLNRIVAFFNGGEAIENAGQFVQAPLNLS
jgi:hypothetical protein